MIEEELDATEERWSSKRVVASNSKKLTTYMVLGVIVLDFHSFLEDTIQGLVD